jgi:tRNA(Ile)-lysidine synthase
MLYADADTLPLPLQVRPWRSGDRFRPLGMQKSRLVSDFFTDLKLDLEQKRRAGIVYYEDSEGEHIVAVAGIPSPRIDDRHKITSATRRIAAIRVICNR